MKPEYRDKWVAALRSGEYVQGKGNLKLVGETITTPIRHCCLGVLCELVKDEVQGEWRDWHTHARPSFWISNDDHSETILPQTVLRLVGLDREQCDELANLNDAGTTFEEIAGMIERDQIPVPEPDED